MFRPGIIIPRHPIRSRTRLYQAFNDVAAPVPPAVKKLFLNAMTTTEVIGRAMIHVARRGHPRRVLETRDVNTAGARRNTA